MCGIAVICGITGQPANALALERMTQSLVHRGPDDSGYYFDGPVGLGFRRLSILDLSPAAHQPMISEDGRFVLVFNGEIYNYVELRGELISAGYRFRSSGDSEVLLNAYCHWGADCLPKLNGMWAFLIYDRVKRCLCGSRDRFGVKPLFIYRNSKHVLFGSEIKAIRASGQYHGGVNWKVASRFLVEGELAHGNESFFEGIESIPAGSAFELDLNGIWKSWTYWELPQECPDILDPSRQCAELFEDAVGIRMRSDVPVGVCLSGGVDSTSIICAAARHRRLQGESPPPLQAFCYMAKEFDESQYIVDTKAMTGAEISELQISPRKLWASLPLMLKYQDEPVHTMTATVGYHLMGLAASRGIHVVLNGQGADEVIGGYFSFFSDYWRELMSRGEWGRAVEEIRAYVRIHGGRSIGYTADTAIRLFASHLQQLPLYRSLANARHFSKAKNHPWFRADLTSRLSDGDRPSLINRLNGVLKQSVTHFPLPLYLRIEDRNSMAHSVEVRMPFLDYRLVSLSFMLSAEWKVQGQWNKFMLRRAMRGRIPESVRSRSDKMGFPTPAQKWFADDLYEPMADLLASRAVCERGIYNVQAVVNDLARHKRGEIDVHHGLFRLTQFEIIAELSKSETTPSVESSHDFAGTAVRSNGPMSIERA